MPPTKPGKKSKRPDDRPARKRYWAKRTLEIRKVGNLMRYCKMTKQAAYKFWTEGKLNDKGEVVHPGRQGRVPNGYLSYRTETT